MSTRQYIGARYVPIFDGEWDNTKSYEPLVIVSYQGNSYTSRTYVPVGVAIDNDLYWALTGNYNAQVEAYRQEVQAVAEDVSTLSSQLTTLVKRSSMTFNPDRTALPGTNYFSRLVKINDEVWLECQWSLTEDYTANTLIYQLPTGYMPAELRELPCFMVANQTTPNITQVKIDSTGKLFISVNQSKGEFTVYGHYAL